MRQDTTSVLSGLASFAPWQNVLVARSNEGCAAAKMTFKTGEVELGHAVHEPSSLPGRITALRFDYW